MQFRYKCSKSSKILISLYLTYLVFGLTLYIVIYSYFIMDCCNVLFSWVEVFRGWVGGGGYDRKCLIGGGPFTLFAFLILVMFPVRSFGFIVGAGVAF